MLSNEVSGSAISLDMTIGIDPPRQTIQQLMDDSQATRLRIDTLINQLEHEIRGPMAERADPEAECDPCDLHSKATDNRDQLAGIEKRLTALLADICVS